MCSLQHARPVVAREEPPDAASPAAAHETATEAPAAFRATTSRDASPAKAARGIMGETEGVWIKLGGDSYRGYFANA